MAFWKSLDAETIAELYRVYHIDFELFGYTVSEYLAPLGMAKRAKQVERILTMDGHLDDRDEL